MKVSVQSKKLFQTLITNPAGLSTVYSEPCLFLHDRREKTPVEEPEGRQTTDKYQVPPSPPTVSPGFRIISPTFFLSVSENPSPSDGAPRCHT